MRITGYTTCHWEAAAGDTTRSRPAGRDDSPRAEVSLLAAVALHTAGNVPQGCLDSVDWNGGMERWNGMEWTGLEQPRPQNWLS